MSQMPTSYPAAREAKAPFAGLDPNQVPMVVIWEITRACSLACIHCRASAIPKRDPAELTLEEGYRLMDQVKEMGSPVFVLTGGDPLMRPDFADLVRYGTKIGLRVSASPSGTKMVTRDRMKEAVEAGLQRVAFSLDGAGPESHDNFRRVHGSYETTRQAIAFCQSLGLQVQIGTTCTRHNIHELPQIAEQMKEMGVLLWNVFFLVPTGRGLAEDMVTPQQHEEVCKWLLELSRTAPFLVKTTEAPFYRRVAAQAGTPVPWMVNDGRGFVFIDHKGEVYPSGFLPFSGGSVRTGHLGDIYRSSPVFQELRDYSKLKGKCGVCEFRDVCGGSRARAFAMTGDYMETDPACDYVPAAWQDKVQ